MANAFLLSHGTRVGDWPETFVPEGKTISFYAQFDENVLRSIGLAALNAGDIEPTQTVEGGKPVPNYYHSRFADNEMAEHLTSVSSATGGAVYFVGGELPDPSYLCTTPDKCATTYPRHHDDCQGVFKLIAEDDIKSVACRGLHGDPNSKATYAMEGSTEFMTELGEETLRILEWAKTDPDAAMQYYQSLSEATRVQLNGANTNLAKWAEQYFKAGGSDTPAAVVEARNFVESHGDIAFHDYAEQMDPVQQNVVFSEQDLLDAFWLGYARKLVRNQQSPEMAQWFATLDAARQEQLSSDREIADALAIGLQGGNVAQTTEWRATDEDFDEATGFNESFAKDLDEGVDAVWEVGGFLVLLGEPSGDLASRVRQAHDYAAGTFRVKRRTFGAGSFEFSGVAPAHQETIKWAVGQFSKKDVEFD